MKRDRGDYWNRRAAAYDRQVSTSSAYADIIRRIQASMPKDARVAELGCGSGQVSCAIAPYASSVDASDLSPDMLALAEAHARREGLHNIRFSLQDAAAAHLDVGAYDLIICLATLHLMMKPQAALAAMRLALAPGGQLVVSAYLSGHSLMSRLGNALMSLRGYRDFQHWNAANFENAVAEQGFRVLSRASYPIVPIPALLLICERAGERGS